MKNVTFIILLLILGSCKSSQIATKTAPVVLPTDMLQIGNMLDSIFVEDQKYRLEYDSVLKEFGAGSREMKDYWKTLRETDVSNQRVVGAILDKSGWLGADEVGDNASASLFLVIQHAKQDFQEKYLPMVRKAAQDGKVKARSLALLEDRTALGRGEMQIYGTQIATDRKTKKMYVLPLMEPEKVNERRAVVGLGTIEEYVANWSIEWDVDEYKKNLPRYLKIKTVR